MSNATWLKQNFADNLIFISKTVMYETNDYSIFNTLNGNRYIDEKKVKKIMRSIQEGKDLKCPVTVNELGEVIDGQHTLEARKRLKKTIYFYIVPQADLKSCISINTSSSNWNTNDYVHSYSINSDEYKRLEEFCIKNHVSASFVVNMIHGSSGSVSEKTSKSADIKRGTFKATEKDYEIAQAVIDCSNQIFKLLNCQGSPNSTFRRAIFIMMNNDAYDHKTMIRRCKAYKYPFKMMRKVSDILIELSKVYSTSKNTVHFEEYKSIMIAKQRDYLQTNYAPPVDDRYFKAE